MTLGNAIKTVRTACKIKQRDLAVRIGVSANYISLVEGDKRDPSVSFLKRLAGTLGVPVSVFFLWQEFDRTGINANRMRRIRELLVGIEASYLFQKRSPVARKQASRH
jgi:transcriptional regulator with XRE-family HTH domain